MAQASARLIWKEKKVAVAVGRGKFNSLKFNVDP
jgi:hypothetical protein